MFAGQSEPWDKHFPNGNVQQLGSAERYKRFGGNRVRNTSFAAYCALRGVGADETDRYNRVVTNLDAGYKSTGKYDKNPHHVLDEDAFRTARDWAIQHFKRYMGGSRVATLDEVAREINPATSAGYPHNLVHRTKKQFLSCKEAMRMVDLYWDESGRVQTSDLPKNVPIWTCSQKNELRGQEKLDAQKHRTFLVSPVEHSLNLNRLCLDMNNRFYASSGNTWSFVGGTKFLGGWETLYRRMNRHGNGFALDAKDYDSSLLRRFMAAMIDIRWEFLREEDRTSENRARLEVFYDAVINSVIVMEDGRLIIKHTGNPSGSVNTIVDNTLILFMLFAYTWFILAREQYAEHNRAVVHARRSHTMMGVVGRYDGEIRGGYDDFMRHVEAALNGDDNTFTVSDEVVGWFNATTIQATLAEIGMTITSDCMAPRPVIDLDFLSQRFVVHGERILPAPFDPARVLSSMMWGSEIDDVRWHLLRAYALRSDSWGDLRCRSVLNGYIDYLLREHGHEMRGIVNGVDIETVHAAYKTDSELWRLYTGRESSASVESLQMCLDQQVKICVQRADFV